MTEAADADTCGAQTSAGDPCELPAGWGTDRDGGKCKYHGGAGGRPIEHGLYSEAARDGLQEKIQAARAEPLGDLTGEMAVLRALLTRYLESLGAVDADALDAVTTLVGEIRRTADTVSKVTARHALTAEHIDFLRSRLAHIFRKYVPEEDRADALDALRDAVDADHTPLDP